MEFFVTLTGITGTEYRFTVHEIGTEFLNVAGVYAFCAKAPARGLMDELFPRYVPLYVGESMDLGHRLHTNLNNHHRLTDAKARGATHVAVMHTATVDQRMRVERDLIAAYNPPCNRETVNPRSLFGPY
ncbi:hypothetical protein GWI72_10320 [Microvirga tunisiensis]|uniref:GIY-YIG nuclease family protein n=1 Tax=Pannonibacter tanglangensis TaxID=2750084 RepID=A0A7X5J9T8_9HYPH|nr:hypothetical protein [Pannonibacter sp. XCT-53]NBN78660.1 hypothetical protein [Pannonibacter sp. XCT-53]